MTVANPGRLLAERNQSFNPIQLHKALTDETRLKCIMLVYLEKELCVCEFCEALQQIQPKVSRNLAQLKKSELLLDRRQGQWVFYRLNPALPSWVTEILALTTENNMELIGPHLAVLKRMGNRPERTFLCC